MGMAQKHTNDLRNIQEGDSVTLETTNGERIRGECINYSTERADPRSGEVRQSKIWEIESPVGNLVAIIIDGLRSSESDPDFPQHSPVWNLDKKETVGYLSKVEIHGREYDSEVERAFKEDGPVAKRNP